MIDRKVPPLEHKLLILHTIREVGSVTNLQLLQFMVDNALMDYITLQLALGEMTEAGQLEMIPHPLGDLYRLTPLGDQALSLFETRVPYSRRQAAHEAAQAWKKRFEREQQLLSRFEKRPDGQFDLFLSLLENDAPQLLLRLTLPAWNMADLFSRTWPGQAQRIYARVLRTLGEEYQPQQRLLSQEKGASLAPQPSGESLLCLGGSLDPLQASLPMPPSQDAACHMAERFCREQGRLMNFITAQLTQA